MEIDHYATRASALGWNPKEIKDLNLVYLGLGLAGETGEVVEMIKRHMRGVEIDRAALADELGDVAYYWARLCLTIGHEPSQVLDQSLKKIESRRSANPR